MSDFSVDVSQWVDDASEALEKIIRQTVQEMGQRIVMRTPVDTGAARGGWWPALGMTPQLGGGAADPGGQATVSRIAMVAAQMKPGDVFTLANNIKYIRKLEYGSSKQAPGGMMRITAAEGEQIVEDMAALVT